MNIDLTGKKALVCGATQGIGLAIAQELAQSGASVVIAGRSDEKINAALGTLVGPGHQSLSLDQSNISSIEDAAGEVANSSIDILVNNTGGPDPGLVSEEVWDNFELALTKQLRCSHLLTQASLSHMKANKFGRVINVISTSVKIPIYGLGVSNTVRGAISSWSKTLSLEVANSGITINNILPGFIDTGRLKQIIDNKSDLNKESSEQIMQKMIQTVPRGRFGMPSELGYLAVFLSSEYAAYITGTSIPVDGGKTGSF